MKSFDLRKTVAVVASLNFMYFGVEFLFAQIFDSLALLSDSLDFLEDASINLLILLAMAWSIQARKKVSYVLALVLLMPGMVFAVEAVSRFNKPVQPDGIGMSLVGIGALIVNVYCAALLTSHKGDVGGLAKAAYLSARNDALANLLIISAGALTYFWVSRIPDLVIGVIIFSMNFDAARKVLKAPR